MIAISIPATPSSFAASRRVMEERTRRGLEIRSVRLILHHRCCRQFDGAVVAYELLEDRSVEGPWVGYGVEDDLCRTAVAVRPLVDVVDTVPIDVGEVFTIVANAVAVLVCEWLGLFESIEALVGQAGDDELVSIHEYAR